MKKLLFLMPMTLVLAGCPLTGDKGTKGGDGEIGQQGVQGVQGVQGIQGVAGIQGTSGLACWDLNSDGLQTVADPNDPEIVSEDINLDGGIDVLDCTGLTGAEGAAGAQGAQGEAGASGEQGAQGIRGKPGPRGVQGIVGATGATGARGAIGPRGPRGPRGAIGISVPSDPCLSGVYITGAYMHRWIPGAAAPEETPWLIVDTNISFPGTFGVMLFNTVDQTTMTVNRDISGNLPSPWIGSCRQLPPITP